MDDILKSAKECYFRTLASYKKNNYKANLNLFWELENRFILQSIIAKSKIAEDVLKETEKTTLYSVIPDPDTNRLAVEWMKENKLGGKLNISESNYSNQEQIVKLDGISTSANHITKLQYMCDIEENCNFPQEKFSVLELGAGAGHLARILKTCHKKVHYTILDIPETLFVSYCFLRLNFPEARCLWITDVDTVNNMDDYDFVFVPAMMSSILHDRNFHLFINTSSLGEMKNEVIEGWMDLIQNKINVKYVFMANRYLNTMSTDIGSRHRMHENECSVLFDAKWNLKKWDLEPMIIRCPYAGRYDRVLEIIAERKANTDKNADKLRSRQLLDIVKKESWYTSGYPPLPATLVDFSFVKDTTMSGTIFKLWDSIRLDCNKDNVDAMIKYLDFIMRSDRRVFEEMYYYKKLFGGTCRTSLWSFRFSLELIRQLAYRIYYSLKIRLGAHNKPN